MAEAYTSFAYVYEKFMNNVPYDEWARYLKELLEEYGIKEGLICELGCGTGLITRRMAEKGYDMIGIDLSEDMLGVAREAESDPTGAGDRNILYLKQDMRDFELYGTVSAVLCICDSLNYLLDMEEIKRVFRLVNTYLNAGGIFIFDLKTEYFYRDVLGSGVIAENHEDCSIIWENDFFEDCGIHQYEITIYQKAASREAGGSFYTRTSEVHHQSPYSVVQIKACMEEAGLSFLHAYPFGTRDAPDASAERICFIARENYQEGKLYLEPVPERH